MPTEASLEPCQTSRMELFVKLVNGFKPSTILAKRFILKSQRQGFEKLSSNNF